ncbi:MAG: hypothetical protein V1717_01680 [Candidatus Micrarchaeota archaeon]
MTRMELNLPSGPWKEIASADWNGTPVGIYLNPDKTILVLAFSKETQASEEGGKKNVLLFLRKPLFLEGSGESVEKFLQSQKRDLSFVEKIVVEKIVAKKQFRYVLLEAQPSFVEFKQDKMAKAVKEQQEELDSLVKVTMDVAVNYGCRARELSKVDESASEYLFGDPLTLLFLGSGRQAGGKKMFTAFEEKKIPIGFAVDGGDVLEVSPMEMQTVFVSGEGKTNRLKAMQVCVENLLVSGIPCVVFGESDTLEGIAFPNKNSLELERAGLPKPTGFPLKTLSVGKGFFVDLRFISPESFARLFFPEDLKGIVEGAWGESSLSELRESLERQEQKYAVAKAARVIRVLEKEFGGSFGANASEELRKAWREKTGRVWFVKTPENPVLQSLAIESVLNSFDLGGENDEDARLAVAIETDSSKLAPQARQSLSVFQDKAFFIFNSSDSFKGFEGMAPTLELDVLNEREAVVSLAGEKKRVFLRPTFSNFEQTQAAVQARG